jgi:hypothetical protein
MTVALNVYQKQLEQVEQFKTRVLDSVQKRQFNQVSLMGIIEDAFVGHNSQVVFSTKDLEDADADGTFEVIKDTYQFTFSQKKIDRIKNKNLEELEKSNKLNIFGNFFESITHEVKHGWYEVFCGEKQEFLFKKLDKIVTQDVADKIVNEDLYILADKCTDSEYYKPSQVAGAITRIATKYGQKDNKLFQKVLFLSLLDEMKNEQEAYLEGFKAKRQILGNKARFFDIKMKFAEAVEDNDMMRQIVQEGYFNKFVPVKKLNRYF